MAGYPVPMLLGIPGNLEMILTQGTCPGPMSAPHHVTYPQGSRPAHLETPGQVSASSWDCPPPPNFPSLCDTLLLSLVDTLTDSSSVFASWFAYFNSAFR